MSRGRRKIENSIIQKLKDSFPEVLVQGFPDKPSEFILLHPIGALLVHYQGSNYTNSNALGIISQENKKEFELNLKRKQAIKVEIKENYVPYKVFQSVKRRAKVLLEEENLSNLVYKIVKVEAPIHINLLKRRLMDITSVSKLSDEQVNLLAKVVQEDKFKYKDEFVYLSEGQVYQVRNRSLLDKYSKKVEYISKEEIDEAIKLSLNRGEASTEDEIVKMVFTYFGFNSSKVLKDLINLEIEKMLSSNILTKEDEVIYLE